jgi:hypothetical protein
LALTVGKHAKGGWLRVDHRTDRYANNGVEDDHGRRQARLRPNE